MEAHPCFKVFKAIHHHRACLVQLGNEVLKVLEDMRLEGMPMDVVAPRFVEAIKATWQDGNKTTDIEVKTQVVE